MKFRLASKIRKNWREGKVYRTSTRIRMHKRFVRYFMTQAKACTVEELPKRQCAIPQSIVDEMSKKMLRHLEMKIMGINDG